MCTAPTSAGGHLFPLDIESESVSRSGAWPRLVGLATSLRFALHKIVRGNGEAVTARRRRRSSLIFSPQTRGPSLPGFTAAIRWEARWLRVWRKGLLTCWAGDGLSICRSAGVVARGVLFFMRERGDNCLTIAFGRPFAITKICPHSFLV